MDTIRWIFTVVIVFFIAVHCAIAVERRTYPCHRLAQAPIIDGKFDDEAWQKIPEASGFYVHGGGLYAVERQTYFRAGWTEDAIYLAVRAEENEPGKISAKLQDGDTLWLDDSIELFFFPTGAPNYTQLVANSVGKRWNGCGMRAVDLMNWDAKAVVGKTEWCLELRIPFPVLMGKMPKEGDVWLANIARNIRTGIFDEVYTCWPLLKKGFHDVPNFGRFVFKGLADGNIIDEEKAINGTYIQSVHEALGKLAGRAKGYEQKLAEARESETCCIEADRLLAIWKQVAEVAAQPAPDWRKLVAVRFCSLNLPRKSDECTAKGMMEKLFME